MSPSDKLPLLALSKTRTKGITLDPQACFERWKDNLGSIRYLRALADAQEAHRDLTQWLSNGGFEPDWTDIERLLFEAWHPASGSFRVTLGEALPWLKVRA